MLLNCAADVGASKRHLSQTCQSPIRTIDAHPDGAYRYRMDYWEAPHHDLDIARLGALIMENRELRQRIDTITARIEHAFDLLKPAYRAIIDVEAALKHARNA